MRVLQGVGGALIMANSTAILTDAFPPKERGFALGINVVAAIGGQFLGLVIGGLLADTDWRLVFWVNVPIGLIGTVWAYLKLKDGPRRGGRHPIDWGGNLTFGLGLILILSAITYGIQPYGTAGHGLDQPESPDALRAWASCRWRPSWSSRRIVDRPMLDFRLLRIPAARLSAISPTSPPPSGVAGCSSCSSSGCRGSGCRCMAIPSSRRRCGRRSSCFR